MIEKTTEDFISQGGGRGGYQSASLNYNSLFDRYEREMIKFT